MTQKLTAVIVDRDHEFANLLSDQLVDLGIHVLQARREDGQADVDRSRSAQWLFIDAEESLGKFSSALNTSTTIIVMGWDQELSQSFKDLAPNLAWMLKPRLLDPGVIAELVRERQCYPKYGGWRGPRRS